MKNFIITCLLILLSFKAISQQLPTDANIVGHVTCKGEHLPSVNIVIENTNIGTNTDQTGHFSITNAPIGQLSVRAQMVGYKPQIIVVEIKENETREIKFELEEDLIGLNEVVITANRNETNKQDASVIVNVISPKVFQSVNAVCLSEGLCYQPGLRVENNCQNCGFQQVRINGLEGPYSQILIDSRPVYSALSGVYGIEQIPVNMIERVEVIRGGGSALYGSNAIAGTINIITKEPLKNSFDVSENYSSIDGKASDNNIALNGSFITDNKKAGLNIFASQRNRDYYDANGDGFSELGTIDGSGLGFRSYYKISDHSKITATYHHLNEFRRGGNKFDLQPHETDITEQTEHKITGGGLTFEALSHDGKNKLSLYASGQQTKRKSYYGAQQDLNAYGKTDDLSAMGGIQFFHCFDKLLFTKANLTTGMEYQINNMHDQMPGYQRDLEQKIEIAGLFLQNEWESEHVHFLVGARLDKHNLIDKAVISPRVNLLMDLSKQLQWRISYSTGFRAPQAFDEDLHILAVGGEVMLIQLAVDLKTERSQSISTSFDNYYDLLGFENNLMVEGFYTKLTDVFIVEEIGTDAQGNKLMERRNGSGARVMGINLENRTIINPEYQLQFGLTLQQNQYIEEETWSDDSNIDPVKKMPRSPEVYGYLSFTANPVKNFKTFVTGTYTGSMLVPHYAGFIETDRMEETSDFIDLNFKLGYDFKLKAGITIRFETGIQNILNSYQSDFDKGEYRDAGYIYGPMKPRTVFAGIKIGNFI